MVVDTETDMMESKILVFNNVQNISDNYLHRFYNRQ